MQPRSRILGGRKHPRNPAADSRHGTTDLSTITRLSRDVLLAFGVDGLITFANSGADGEFGYGPGGLEGLALEQIFPGSGPVIAENAVPVLWTLARRHDGSLFPAELAIDEVSPRQDEAHHLIHLRNLSKGEPKDRIVTMIVESLDDALTIWDHSGRLLLWNDRANHIYSGLQCTLALGLPYAEFLASDPAGGDLSTGNAAPNLPKSISFGNGWCLTRERDLPGGAMLRIDTDITAQKQREVELRAMMEQAEEANRSKSNFLANMSHELRTPLNAVIGFSDMLKTQLPALEGSEKLAGYAEDIANSGAHLLDLVNLILDLSRIEAGHHELHPEQFEPGEVVSDVLRLIRVIATQSQVQLRNAVPDNLPLLEADRPAFRQVLLNLLSNAIKFTPEGGLVTVIAAVEEDMFAVTITDTGIGIAKEDLPRLFNPFEQIENAYSRSRAGFGLGLTITRRLVELHDGMLSVESEPGTGTSVTVRLPLVFSVAGN